MPRVELWVWVLGGDEESDEGRPVNLQEPIQPLRVTSVLWVLVGCSERMQFTVALYVVK